MCVSGLTWDSVAPCVRWMTPFMDTLRAEAPPTLKVFPKVKADDRHNIQTHVAYLELLVSRLLPPARRGPRGPGATSLISLCFAEKSSESPAGRPRLSAVTHGGCGRPDSAQQRRETAQSLSRPPVWMELGFLAPFRRLLSSGV